MRALVAIPALLFPGIMALSFAASTPPASSAPAVQTTAEDCAVIAAVSKQHFSFSAQNAPPPLRIMDDAGWSPACDWSTEGLAFTAYTAPAPGSDPRDSLKWVEFKKPVYDAEGGATIETGIMHGPLAGMGYQCTLHSGAAGWTLLGCKNTWVS